MDDERGRLETLEGQIEKLNERIARCESQLLDLNGAVRPIVVGHVDRAKVEIRSCLDDAEDRNALARFVVGVLATAAVIFTMIFVATQWWVQNPRGLRWQIPPPHSTEMPMERR